MMMQDVEKWQAQHSARTLQQSAVAKTGPRRHRALKHWTANGAFTSMWCRPVAKCTRSSLSRPSAGWTRDAARALRALQERNSLIHAADGGSSVPARPQPARPSTSKTPARAARAPRAPALGLEPQKPAQAAPQRAPGP
eukprot:CAMPEP_0168363326 /NCGR_PEP_ID=MMETSP0228-20121227/3632_1 /TAXON_ID=133427 /ORGANISM="Protoceratium reticulatum, Strain CCCM 535 (=CCMP 1889)" /LENGTH=138 /DNA_ID=CAMNT_0008376047 /DNA_START=146 /DNA_END=558 /DNA_ORIENTATION=-